MLDSNMHWIGPRSTAESMRLVYAPSISHVSSYSALETASNGGLLEAATGTTPSQEPEVATPNVRRAVLINHHSSTEFTVQDRKFEVNTQCRVFLGKSGLRIYTSFLSVYIYFTLWAYTSVFASAMAKSLPLWGDDNNDYVAYAVVFASVVVPLSCMELHEQVTMQVALTAARFVMLAFMLMTAQQAAKDLEHHEYVPLQAVHLSGLSSMVSICVLGGIR